MKISNLLSWGSKRAEAEERRKEPRYSAEGPMTAYWIDGGELQSVRGRLADAGEGGSGIGFYLPSPIPVNAAAWITTSEGETFSGVIRHAEERDGEYRAGAQLDLEEQVLEGWGGVQLHWIDASRRQTQVASATLRNGDEGALEVNCAAQAPLGELVLITGLQYSCLCRVRKSEPYGKRYLLEVEPIADATEQPRVETAA